jgi:hypothetical protein
MGQQTESGPRDAAQLVATDRRMFHVTITVAGPDLPEHEVREALERLAERHQFLLSGRYATDRAEIRFWDEGAHLRDAAARALLLWSEHAGPAELPPWEVVGLEVVDRDTFHARGRAGELTVPAVGSGDLRPF